MNSSKDSISYKIYSTNINLKSKYLHIVVNTPFRFCPSITPFSVNGEEGEEVEGQRWRKGGKVLEIVFGTVVRQEIEKY